ncbi:DUF262 domain-containing protein [Nocardioides sp. WL0053]|uniref:DUF262 domain-containing protein n=1 Tax=Nocardioides jiangsuensis TaxID=2866161 RepID=A0ABS7RN52_9ACTN|nr:DUF262 domain-containing protein [Nocardioides jiangsuensis]MBY9075957.1 DUF262 domain-containing protein [Nocardioides jiangsuensis]
MSDRGMTGYRTSFHRMFGEQVAGAPSVDQVEIPLIQRDYAQGRQDARTNAIRGTFLDALHTALTEDVAVGLDFIYGEVRDGKFEPLDGQQRLTTLFLLHWYVAFRRGGLDGRQPWASFTYATRPSARLFCERIVKYPPPSDLAGPPSAWITDQSWYLHLWRFDPTIRAMLVTLDAIAERFSDEDAEELWTRLTDDTHPAIWFQLLPIDEMGAAEDLYIKMNSRGKPLTAFEAFKAHLGQLVAESGAADDFGHKIDGVWTDLFWPYRGDNDIVDDEFMRYFDFLVEVCEWRENRIRGEEVLTPEQRINALLSCSNPRRKEHLDFICAAFDTWVADRTIADVFADLFKSSIEGDGVRLFGAPSTDLFHACCERYGATRGTTRLFSLTDTLLLFAVLTHRIDKTEDARTRLRSLRNVNEASQFEMRVQNMPKFIAEVAEFMHSGDLASLATFNQNQVADENAKRALRGRHPELAASLARLEDHNILRGTLSAFDLGSSIEARAGAFEAVFDPKHWPLLTGALLATGEYQRDYPDSDRHRFGSPTTESVWRLLLVDRGDRVALTRARTVLGKLLDRVAGSNAETDVSLCAISDEFINDRSAKNHYDWRYYLVRYSTMREGNSGIYYGAAERLGYELTMLRKTVQRSWYRDAYLYAIWCRAGQPSEAEDPWFYGYSTTPRWMKLTRSGVGLRSVPTGIAIQVPASPEAKEILEKVLQGTAGAVPSDDEWLLSIPQVDLNDELIDSVDRVQVGARFLQDLINAGL